MKALMFACFVFALSEFSPGLKPGFTVHPSCIRLQSLGLKKWLKSSSQSGLNNCYCEMCENKYLGQGKIIELLNH